MQTPPRILSFGAHPDDTEFRCGGTLALLARRGWQVGIATVTGGGGGSREHDFEQTRKIRLTESKDAAAVIGAEFHYAGGADMDVDFCHDLRVKVVHVLRAFRPDVVIACPPDDYHTDHEEASRLVRAACFFAPIPNYPEQTLEPIEAVPYLYYTHPGTDIMGRPAPAQFLVDISSVVAVKKQMACCHRSQRNWIRDHHGVDDYVASRERHDAELGAPAGFAAAEALCQHLGAGYPHDNILVEALSDKAWLKGD